MDTSQQTGAFGGATRQQPIAWRQMQQRLIADRRRLKEAIRRPGALFPGYACVRLYRVSNYFHRRRWMRLARLAWQANLFLTGADISPSAEIEGGLMIPHPAGVAIEGVAGRNLTVMALSGIGPSLAGGDEGIPVLGDNVFLAHHSGIHGPVRIGNDVRISPGCVVTTNIDDGVTVEQPPVRLLRAGVLAASRDRPVERGEEPAGASGGGQP